MKSTDVAAHATEANRVLQLDGNGDFVQLPPNSSNCLDEATIEAWVKWQSFGFYSQPFGFGTKSQALGINNQDTTANLHFFIYFQKGRLHLIRVPNVLQLNQWMHIAAVSGKSGMKLYLNGMLVGAHPFTGSFSSLEGEQRNYLGKPHWEEHADFHGQLDEIRVWKVERTAEHIRESMHQRLTGREADLVGLWNFDAGDARDASPNRYDGHLVGQARCVLAQTPSLGESIGPIVLYGTVTDEAGKPLANATVRLESTDAKAQMEVQTDTSGRYQLVVFPMHGRVPPKIPSTQHEGEYNLSATCGVLGDWRLGLRLLQGERQKIDFMLKESARIEGTLLALDSTPHLGVTVQAIQISEWANEQMSQSANPQSAINRHPQSQAIATTLSGEDGKYQFTNLKPGQYQVRCHTANGDIYTFT